MKCHTVFRGISLYTVLALILAGVSFSACVKKEEKKEQARAMASFVIGKVTLERAGEPARPLQHKDELKQGDTVKTGADSMAVIQISDDSLIKIESGTSVTLVQFMDKGNTRFDLAQGRMFTRVNKLTKESTFKVYTKTSLAAVRGTEFSVTAHDNDSVVAVNEGTVAVQKVSNGKETNEEQAVEKGKAADVKASIRIRPVNAGEKKEFKRFAKITPIDDLDGTSEADLKRMEDDYQKNKDRETEIDKDKNRKKGKDDKSAAQDKPKENGTAKNTMIWTGKSVYGTTDAIIVNYKNMPEYRTCWIDISKASDSDGRYQSYQWTYSAKNGTMTFAGMNLAPGAYEVRAHFGRSGSVDKRFRFQVR